jgi:hypothetical protein
MTLISYIAESAYRRGYQHGVDHGIDGKVTKQQACAFRFKYHRRKLPTPASTFAITPLERLEIELACGWAGMTLMQRNEFKKLLEGLDS